MKIKKEIIKAYALKNAVEHDGKAVAGSVISGLFNHGLEKDKINEIMPEVNQVLKEINSFFSRAFLSSRAGILNLCSISI